MCCLDKKERLTLDLVVDRMRGMNLETYIKRDDLFSDLHKLSQS